MPLFGRIGNFEHLKDLSRKIGPRGVVMLGRQVNIHYKDSGLCLPLNMRQSVQFSENFELGINFNDPSPPSSYAPVHLVLIHPNLLLQSNCSHRDVSNPQA